MRQQYIPGSGPLRLTAQWGHSRAASGLTNHPWRTVWLALAAVIAAALGLAACGSSSSSSSDPASALPNAASGSASSAIDGATVLTNTQGFTLYMFAPDTGTASKCNGSCAQIWPPVTSPVTAGPGITGTLGTIMRADGATQATYDGHPLYTYAGDTQPGQAKGNGIKGVWHEVTPGSAAAASSPGTGGNGY